MDFIHSLKTHPAIRDCFLLRFKEKHQYTLNCDSKGQVIRETFSFNISRNNVALQVERVAARITTAFSTFHATNFSVVSCSNMVRKVDPSFTFCNKFFQLVTLKFVAWQVEHAVVIRATTPSTCNATMFRDKLKENVARIIWP